MAQQSPHEQQDCKVWCIYIAIKVFQSNRLQHTKLKLPLLVGGDSYESIWKTGSARIQLTTRSQKNWVPDFENRIRNRHTVAIQYASLNR
jgi:hypothetical protein